MALPIQVQSQLYHFKSRILALVAAQVFRMVMVSRLFGISRKTSTQCITLCSASTRAEKLTISSPFSSSAHAKR